jgi:cholesterol transport system auxiliary component
MTQPSSTARQRLPRPWRAALAATALTVALGACSTPPVPAFDLSAARQPFRGMIRLPGQLVVLEPTGLQPLEAESILVRDNAGAVSVLGGGQWADRLPRVIQTRLIETFENASVSKTVSRPGDGITADYQLNTQIRAFQLEAGRGEVLVELSEKLLNVPTGKIVRAKVFTARVPVASSAAPEVAQALDHAMTTVFVDVARWVGGGR